MPKATQRLWSSSPLIISRYSFRFRTWACFAMNRAHPVCMSLVLSLLPLGWMLALCLYKNMTNHPISSNSHLTATANKAKHCLKRGWGLQNQRKHHIIFTKYEAVHPTGVSENYSSSPMLTNNIYFKVHFCCQTHTYLNLKGPNNVFPQKLITRLLNIVQQFQKSIT